MRKTVTGSPGTKPLRLFAILLSTVMALAIMPPLAAQAAGPAGNVGSRANTYDDPVGGIYVSPTGNDTTATGSIDRPYRHINAALAAASPGATIILRGGNYFEGANTEVRVRQPNITIKSANGEWARIDLPFASEATDPYGNNGNCTVRFDPEASGGKLQAVEVSGGFYAVCLDTKWGWGGPDDHVAASNITIEDCVLRDSRRDVVKVKPNCDNVTIRYNEIYNSGRGWVGASTPANGEDNAECIDNVNGDNIRVQNNYIHDSRGNGIYAKGGAMDALIENNIIERILGAGVMVGFDTSPDFFDLAANPQWYENIRGVVRNNLIMDIGWEGIGLYGSKDAQVYNNTLVNVNNGSVHSAIYFGLTYQDWDSGAGRPANVNPSIHHNIVCQPSTFSRQMIEIRYSGDLGGMSALSGNPTMHDNCYYIDGKSAAFTDTRPGRILTNAGLAAWKTHIGGDSGSLGVNPALGTDSMPTNPQCAGMGLLFPLIVGSSAISAAPVITTSTLPGGTVGTAYSASLAATGAAPITWSVTSGSLPAGLSLAANGVISGTPTAAATSTFTVTAANSAGSSSKALSIVINASGTSPAKGIFGTDARYTAWWCYLLFFLCFGFLWMW